MRAWRRKALRLFPEVRTELEEGDSSISDFFFALIPLAAAAHRPPEHSEVLRRVHGFAEWCLHQGGELRDAAGIGFYEDLFHEGIDWSLLVPWLSPFVLAELERTWAYKYPDRSAEFQKLVASRRRHAYRDHAYATGEIDSL